jgi:hypothetical protein
MAGKSVFVLLVTGVTQSPAKREVWRAASPLRTFLILMVLAGSAGKYHQYNRYFSIIDISGRLRLPEPLHRVNRINHNIEHIPYYLWAAIIPRKTD